ncbi:capsid cement protein [Bradyrhizobium sp. ORS 285]|uniref:capsid cement protein n=1 Tax=Bradyrhizobium sp. ORS 285 TaxID=115808 RepID=UPI000682E3E4|nr:capsid cement protein [Bradyrhizobium sp. ORS 285]
MAGADLSASQNLIVKAQSDGTLVLAAAATDAIVGVLKNYPVSGHQAVYQFTGVTKVKAGGTINPGDFVTSNGSGAAVSTTTNGDTVIGRYVGTAAAASGDLIEVQMGIFRY